jgi:high-affinity nickel-transport protein
VFAIGLRHGADPDHLAAIDNLTRNASERMPRTSRFVGAFFAIGHSAMVVAIALVAATVGARVTATSSALEYAGSVASIVVLAAMVVFNVVTLVRPGDPRVSRVAFIPRLLRDARNPLVAIPIGALFGLGFETSSQLIAYGAAFSSGAASSGVAIGAAFCAGMIVTDTLDSIFVARVVGTDPAQAARMRRPWIVVVTIVALVVAVLRIFELLGGTPPFDEVVLSIATVVLLVATAIVLTVRGRLTAVGNRA